jgi:hydrogenase small subunit
MITLDDGLYAAILRRGMSRRSFIKFCAAMTAVLALPATYAPRVAAAVAAAPRIPLIWLRGQDCGGDSAAFLGASNPTAAELVLDLLSVEYDEMIMAPSGAAAEQSRMDTQEKYPNGYIAVVEGGIPTADDGAYCTVGGRAFRDIVREVCDGALATIAVGSCASDGGSPAAAGGPTGAVGVAQVVPNALLVSLPGCPVNVKNLTATIIHYLTFNQPRRAIALGCVARSSPRCGTRVVMCCIQAQKRPAAGRRAARAPRPAHAAGKRVRRQGRRSRP